MKKDQEKLNLLNFVFLISTPVIALIGVPLYAYYHGFHWATVALFAFYMVATGISVTAGYHRLFAHRVYEAHPAVQIFFLLFGAAACENSVIAWSSGHRRHHAYTEQTADPYNINKGFFHAHMGWIFYDHQTDFDYTNVSDLRQNALIRWQNNYYWRIVILVGFLTPLALGGLWHDAVGTLLLVGVTRTVLVHHCTFFINSLCHYLGKQTYSTKLTARDSALMALLTYGEGYHNFHHYFQADYRNGVKWYQWDPTKWLIMTLAFVGLADKLQRVPDLQIFSARLSVEWELARKRLRSCSMQTRKRWEKMLGDAHDGVLQASARWDKLKADYQQAKKDSIQYHAELVQKLEQELSSAQQQLKVAQDRWMQLVRDTMSPQLLEAV